MEINRYEIKAGVERPVTALVVSDLHSGAFGHILDKIKELSPDAVLCPGDVIHTASPKENGFDFLVEAAKLCPVFCSVGNHEVKHGIDVKQNLRDTGAVLLDNEWTEFCGITIGGLSTGYSVESKQGRIKKTPRPKIEKLDGFFACGGFKLLLSHHPEYYDRYLKDKDVDLVISGHAHGGQWRVFGRGVFAPGQGIFPKYTSGLYKGRLLVSRGLANNTYIPRIFNDTEPIMLYIK